MSEAEKTYHSIAEKIPDAVKSQMFGKPCYKVNGKAFCCFFQEEMVFKLTGDVHHEALSFDGSQLFDPSGKKRPMKEWVQVSFDYQDSWEKFAQAAADYVKAKTR